MSSQTPIKKSLPAKHNQLVVYSYWILNQLKSSGKLTDESFTECLEKFHVFHSVEIQKEFFDHYLEDFKMIHKNLKKETRLKNKKPKVKKEKTVDPAQPPKKRGRKRKEIVDNRSPEEILLDEIIRNCQKPPDEKPEAQKSEDEQKPKEKEEESEDEIEVTKVVIHNVTYLIDTNDTLYNLKTHDELGKFDRKTLQIIYDSDSDADADEL